jgi:hypothetical protein
MNRRQLLRTTGIALAAGLAGCGGSGDTETTGGDSPPSTAPETPGGTSEPTETPTATADQSTPTPDQSTPTPDQSTPTPDQSTPTPDQNTPTPDQSTPTPDQSTPTPDQSTPTPEPSTPTPEPSTPTPEPVQTVQLVIDNVGIEAWTVVRDESGSVAPTDTENPTMTFEVGTRYVVGNRGWDFHPFALRGANDESLLSQQASGSFESDPAVNWRDDGDELAFTMTADLASALDYYICTVHNAMRGDAGAN